MGDLQVAPGCYHIGRALLDPSTHFRPPLTRTSTGRPQPFQNLSDPHPQPNQAFLYVRSSRFRRFGNRRTFLY
jgi:hypothetical protein